ncbi:NAD(P)H-dependent oxidoreductase [Metaclostridioides mangenotii]|uniref:NAD(P)H-dependent oxidoreductase n=1 Tax=Metaclostridioides mangenotii TaxID=1540 RepID=UPI0004871A03|nr:NAD(P)H-dependent oxidoreductase [Clostridioides mangenotii]
MTTIILAHPWHGSFNKSILDTIIKRLEKNNKYYTLIDLNKDNFNPVLTESELALYSRGEHKDPLVEKYQKILKETEELIIIFPIWWFDVPAILKGFLDKVMLKDFAYIETSTGLKGLLTNIKKTTVITTSNSPKWYLKYFAGNPIKGLLIKTNLKGVGIKNVKWLHCAHTKKEALQKRKDFLQYIDKFIGVTTT